MRIFSNDNDKYSGRRKSRYDNDNRGRSNRSDRGSVTMYDAVCDECGKDCKVPFRPSGEKPIYCSSCFEKRGNSHEGSGSKSNLQLDEVNEKLDRILKLLESKPEKEIEEVIEE